jgi:TadE-like protein
VLVEFALIALVLYVIFAATLEFGRCLFGAQVLQQATDVMAREISRTPLPPAITLNDVLTDTTGTIDANHQVRNTVFDSAKLVWSFDDAYAGGLTAAENSASLPIVNQLLLPLMIADNETRTLRYPGLVPDPNNPGNWLIAKVTYNTVSDGDAVFTGSEQSITLVPVVEEIVAPGHKPGDTDYATWSPMNLTATNVPASQRGIVALRINYPFQAATLAATAPLPDTAPDRFAPNFHFLNSSADDPTLGDEPADGDMGVYAGQFQLGNMRAAGQIVRPFRRLISAQAIYRREVF